MENKNYTTEEKLEIKELVSEIDEAIDTYVEEFKAEGKSILIKTIIADIASEMDVEERELRSFLINNGSKYFGGNPKICLIGDHVYINSLFQYHKNSALKKLKNNKFLEEMYLIKVQNGII